MIRKHSAIFLAATVVVVSISFPVITRAQNSAGAMKLEKTRSSIESLGVNRDQKVEIKLSDKTKLKGYITGIGADSFILSESKAGNGQTINYSEVAEAKKASGGLSTKTWLILGGIAAGTIVTWIIVKPAVCDGGAQTRGIC